MSIILPRFSWLVKEKLRKQLQKCRIAGVHLRYLIVLNLWYGRSVREVERVLQTHNTTIDRVAKRFREDGEAPL